jgi:hypothetical protein
MCLPSEECVYLQNNVFTFRRMCLFSEQCAYLQNTNFTQSTIYVTVWVCTLCEIVCAIHCFVECQCENKNIKAIYNIIISICVTFPCFHSICLPYKPLVSPSYTSA